MPLPTILSRITAGGRPFYASRFHALVLGSLSLFLTAGVPPEINRAPVPKALPEVSEAPLPPPTFSGCPPSDIIVTDQPGQCGAIVTWTPPRASSEAINVDSNYRPGEVFLPGTTTVIYRAENALGEIGTCSFDVVVADTEAPVLSGPSDIIVSADNSPGLSGCGAVVDYPFPVATDNCVPNVGIYPIFEQFEVPSRNDLIAECWGFSGTVVSTNNPLAGASSMRTSGMFNGSRTLFSPFVFLNGTGEISFLHRLDGLFGTNTLSVSLEDQGGNLTTIFTFPYTNTAVQSVRIPVSQTGIFRVRIDFTSTVSSPARGRLDELVIPGLKLSDPANSCALAAYPVIQTAGLPPGAVFPVGTTTNTFEVTDASGNTATYSFDVTVESDVPAPGVATPVSYCQGDTAIPLSANGSNLLWYTSATGGTGSATPPTPDTSTPGSTSFWVSQTNSSGCEGPRAEISVVVNPNPIVVANASQTNIIAGEPVTLTGSGASTYMWDNGVTDGDTVFPTTTTTYTVIGTDTQGCQGTDFVTVVVTESADLSLTKDISTSSNPNPDPGETLVFELTLTNDGPSPAANVTVEDIIPSGYTLVSVNQGGSISGNVLSWTFADLPVGNTILSYEVIVNPPTADPDVYLNVAQVTASDTPDPDSTPGNDDGDQSEDDEASYRVPTPVLDLQLTKTADQVTAAVGDNVLFLVSVTNTGSFAATGIGIEDLLPAGFRLLEAVANIGTYDANAGLWELPQLEAGQTATLQLSVEVTDGQDYTNIAAILFLDQIDSNPDNDRDTATIEVVRSDCLLVYNQFSPNGDGANDVFFIECIEDFPNNRLQVFNRWGNKVFEARGYDNTWNGTLRQSGAANNNEDLPVGTYYYLLDPGDGTDQKTGWVYITR